MFLLKFIPNRIECISSKPQPSFIFIHFFLFLFSFCLSVFRELRVFCVSFIITITYFRIQCAIELKEHKIFLYFSIFISFVFSSSSFLLFLNNLLLLLLLCFFVDVLHIFRYILYICFAVCTASTKKNDIINVSFLNRKIISTYYAKQKKIHVKKKWNEAFVSRMNKKRHTHSIQCKTVTHCIIRLLCKRWKWYHYAML